MATSSPLSSLLVFQLLLATATIVAAEGIIKEVPPGGSAPAQGINSYSLMYTISDVGENNEVQAFGRFAVSENAQKLLRRRSVVRKDAAVGCRNALTFVRVYKAYMHLDDDGVSGSMYYLKVITKDSTGNENSYDAVVVKEPPPKNQTLLSFEPSSPLPPI